MTKKRKIAVVIIVLLTLLSLACNDIDTVTNTPVADSTAGCFDRAFKECSTISNDPQTCTDFANLNCGD